MLHAEAFIRRFERLKHVLELTDEGVAVRLGYTRQTIWRIAKGQQNVTRKALLRLADVERVAGIAPPVPAVTQTLPGSEGSDKKKVQDAVGGKAGVGREGELREALEAARTLVTYFERELGDRK